MENMNKDVDVCSIRLKKQCIKNLSQIQTMDSNRDKQGCNY